MLVDINPKVLVWAREESFGQRQLKDVAEKLGIESSDLKKWETDGLEVPYHLLEKVAKKYKRQTATFFLPEVPPKTKKIKDYRNISSEDKVFSQETLLAIRRTERYLSVARELNTHSSWETQYNWEKLFSGKESSIDKETERLRELLNSPTDGRLRIYRSDAALRYWRSLIEQKLGIFTFQFHIPENELDGFSYAFDPPPYAIVVNNQQAYVKRVFTLFHELFHIFQHSSGACKPNHAETKGQFEIELECNLFSAKFLVPSRSMKNVHSVSEIFERAREFNVSGEVYLRRLFEEEKISKGIFFDWLSEVREISSSFQRKKRGPGGPSMIILSKSTRGSKFYNLITNAALENQISLSSASDLLGLKATSVGS